jgi:hypothetical protein
MGILRTFDRRREPRKPFDLPLMVWGVDTQGERFLQEAHARATSACLECYEMEDTMQAAVHRLDSDACPWLDLLTEDAPESSPPTDHPTP